VLAQQQNELLRREWENASDEAKRLASALQQERSRAERRYQALKKTSTEERAGRQAEVEAAVSAERARGEAEVRRLKEEPRVAPPRPPPPRLAPRLRAGWRAR